MQTAVDIDLSHLHAELARVDILIGREVRRWQLAGQDINDSYRGLYSSEGETLVLLSRPFGTSWGQTVGLPEDEALAFSSAEAEATRQADRLVEVAAASNVVPRLRRLALTFGLDRFDLDAFLICVAPSLDLRYERLYGFLQDDVTRRRPTMNLILDLLCGPGLHKLTMLTRFADTSPLFKHRLLERNTDYGPQGPTLLSQPISVDESLLTWLLGDNRPHAELRLHARLEWPDSNPTDVLVTSEAWSRLREGFRQQAVLSFYGPDQKSQQAMARLIAATVQRPLLTLDMGSVAKTDTPLLKAMQLALRDASLNDAVVCLADWDVCLVENAPPPELIAEVYDHPGLIVITGTSRWQSRDREQDLNLLWLELPKPGYHLRRSLWLHFLGEAGDEEALDISNLAGQFTLTATQIQDAVALANDTAVQEGRDVQRTDLFAAARSHSAPRLSDLARKIVPRYGWEDIILPPDQLAMLRELIVTVRMRPKVLEEWGVGQKLTSSAGITVLFAGPPGTGKTMGAEIIAGELGLDLYKIDLSTVVSKYIGETEKNLGRIFDEAASSNAVLFFDEADAIFGKRGEVKDSHDRYANIEVSYLLQRMESYDGVTILATNLRSNMDEAFTRRLAFAIDFPFPDEQDRLRIWQGLFPPGVPREADLDLPLLARRFKMAGGNIRNIIVSAAYLAASDGGTVTMSHLVHATRRELQKMGRLVEEVDRVLQ